MEKEELKSLIQTYNNDDRGRILWPPEFSWAVLEFIEKLYGADDDDSFHGPDNVEGGSNWVALIFEEDSDQVGRIELAWSGELNVSGYTYTRAEYDGHDTVLNAFRKHFSE